MKRKLLLAALTVTCAAAGVCGLVACNGDEPAPEHTHSWNDGEVTVAATCTGEGVKTFTCTDEACGETKTEAVAATGHAWDDGEVTEVATCTEAGEKTFACTHDGCDETKSEPVPAKEHAWGDWDVVPATCESDGDVVRVCGNDAKHVEHKEGEPATGHHFGEWHVLMTGDGGGQATKSCENDGCGEYETVELPAVTAKNAYEVTDTATCTKDGKLTYVYRTADGEEFVAYEEESPAKGHSFGETVVTQPADGARGTVKMPCANCDGETYEFDVFNDASTTINRPELGKAYYISYTNTRDTAISSGLAMMGVTTQKGTYEVDVTYFGDKAFELHASRTSVGNKRPVSGNAVLEAYKDNFLVERDGLGRVVKATYIVDGDVFPVGGALALSLSCTIEPEETVTAIMTINFTASKELGVGDNTVTVTDAGVFNDEYTFTSATDKTYSITVPEGVVVCMGSVGNMLLSTGTWANFDAKAGEEIKFIFSNSAAGDIKVTIGDKIALPELAVGATVELTMIAEKPHTLMVADGVTEGTYVIKISGSFLTSKMTGCGYLLFCVNGGYDGASIKENGLAMDARTDASAAKNGWVPDCSGSPWTVTLTLKAGDKVSFAPNNLWNRPEGTEFLGISVTMEAVE